MKFYPNDWRGDPRLRMCSLAARGLGIDLITYMHEGEPYGHLIINGVVPDLKSISALVARPVGEVRKALQELEEKQVFRRGQSGELISRRMVRDKRKSDEGREHIEKRWGEKPNRSPNRSPTAGPITQKPEARIQKEDDDDNAREPLISEAAKKLADEIAGVVGHDLSFIPPAWFGAPYRVQTWMNEGWDQLIILASVREQMGKRRGSKPDRITYFEKGIAAAIARHAQPLPTVKIIEGGFVDVRPKPNSIVEAGRRRLAELAEIKAGLDSAGHHDREGDAGDGANNPDVRLLSKG